MPPVSDCRVKAVSRFCPSPSRSREDRARIGRESPFGGVLSLRGPGQLDGFGRALATARGHGGAAIAAVAITTLVLLAARASSRPQSRSASSTCCRCCWSPRSGAPGSASQRPSPAPLRSTSSTSRRPASSRSTTRSTGSRLRSSSSSPLVSAELAQRARRRADEADQRRREADLAAEMARLLLRGDDLEGALKTVGQRLARALGLAWAEIELGVAEPADRRLAFPLRDGPRQLATLLVPDPTRRSRRCGGRQERVVPALEALIAAALERDELLGNRVEAAALRRTDVLKTALLRAVSHDLRSPLTAIRAAAEPLRDGTLDARRAQGDGDDRDRGVRAPLAPDRQPARPLPARGRRGGAAPGPMRDRRGDPRGGRGGPRRPTTPSGSRSPRTSPRLRLIPSRSSARSPTCSRTRTATRAAIP